MENFEKKNFLHFGNNLGQYGFENFEKILKTNIRKILRKFGAIFYLNFGNNLKKKRFENFEGIYVSRNSGKILRKCQKKFKTQDSEKNLFTFWKSLRK